MRSEEVFVFLLSDYSVNNIFIYFYIKTFFCLRLFSDAHEYDPVIA